MSPDQIRRARCVIDWLVTNEPGRERAESEDAWLNAVTKRIKAQRWAEVCEAVEANPDLSAATIAERLAGKPVAPIPAVTAPDGPPPLEPWTPPEPEPSAGPVLTRTAAAAKVAAIKAHLRTVTKPPIGESA